jgi:hypothetical protein
MNNKLNDQNSNLAAPEAGRVSGLEMGRDSSLPNVKAQRWEWLARKAALPRPCQLRTFAVAPCSALCRFGFWIRSVARRFRDCVYNGGGSQLLDFMRLR